jgi:hypothetical protein
MMHLSACGENRIHIKNSGNGMQIWRVIGLLQWPLSADSFCFEQACCHLPFAQFQSWLTRCFLLTTSPRTSPAYRTLAPSRRHTYILSKTCYSYKLLWTTRSRSVQGLTSRFKSAKSASKFESRPPTPTTTPGPCSGTTAPHTNPFRLTNTPPSEWRTSEPAANPTHASRPRSASSS